jgi:hypothetical protein
MIERGEQLRFAFESRDARGVDGDACWKDLERDIAIQPRIARAIHLAHSAFAQQIDNLIGADFGSRL